MPGHYERQLGSCRWNCRERESTGNMTRHRYTLGHNSCPHCTGQFRRVSSNIPPVIHGSKARMSLVLTNPMMWLPWPWAGFSRRVIDGLVAGIQELGPWFMGHTAHRTPYPFSNSAGGHANRMNREQTSRRIGLARQLNLISSFDWNSSVEYGNQIG